MTRTPQDGILRRGRYSFRILQWNFSVGMIPGVDDAIDADVLIELALAPSHFGDSFPDEIGEVSIRGPMPVFRKTEEGGSSVGALSRNVHTARIVVELMASSECLAYLQRLHVPQPPESLVLELTTDYKVASSHFKKENLMWVLGWHVTHYTGSLPESLGL